MTSEVKNVLDIALVAFNSLFAVAAFAMTLRINTKNSRIENRLKSIEPFIDRENDLRTEAKRIAREKTLALLPSIDKMLESLKANDQSTYKETNYFLRITLRKEFFDAQIYLPNIVSNAMFLFLTSCIRAMGHFSIQEKYWDIMDEVATKYTDLIIEIRKTFYFETADLAPMVEAEIARIKEQGKENAL